MRFVVFGAGAVGGVVGARLFQQGHDVVLIARGPHFDAIRSSGLTIESAEDRTTLPVRVVESPGDLAFTPDDVVLLAMKSQDTVTALDALREATSHALSIVCLQNGVGNERAALRRFPDVYGVCVMAPTAHLEPGVVRAWSVPISGLLDIGRYPSGVDDLARDIASAFRKSTFESEPRPDIMRWKYTKLLMNLGNVVEAVCGDSEGSADLTRRLRSEGAACLRAAGIEFTSQEEDRERRGNLLTPQPIAGAQRGGGSSWQSLARGTGAIETDYLNGEIVLLGRLHGVPIPTNALLQQLAGESAREQRPPGWLPAQEVLGRLPLP
ncbi:MAG: 2-dehydropantoate 2-reductase [Actinomycetia bacterium]|nr:2-dehydropantoate 2-reductase [Actinomycetes bacterium]